MILVRDVFEIEFGRAREAVEAWREGLALAEEISEGKLKGRLLTDLVGPYYTLVVEFPFPSLAAWEESAKKLMGDPAWRTWYPKVVRLAHGGHREIFNIVE